MPIYEYKCKKCGFVFEVLQKIKDAPLKDCIKCGGPIKKVLSPPALQFKGNGWYITDYAKKKTVKEENGKKKAKSKKEDSSKRDTPSSVAK